MYRLLLVVVAVTVVTAGLIAAATVRGREPAPAVAPLRVGTGPEAEATLLAHLVTELLEEAGLPAQVETFGRSLDARQAIELGEIDVLVSYTGAVWLDERRWPDPPGDPQTSYERVKRADRRDGLMWLAPTQANATFALMTAAASGIDTIEELVAALSERPAARLCLDVEFAARRDGLPTLARIYAISDPVLDNQVYDAPPQVAVNAVAGGDCLAGLTTASDGAAWVRGLRPVHDELKAFPAFLIAPVVTEDLLVGH